MSCSGGYGPRAKGLVVSGLCIMQPICVKCRLEWALQSTMPSTANSSVTSPWPGLCRRACAPPGPPGRWNGCTTSAPRRLVGGRGGNRPGRCGRPGQSRHGVPHARPLCRCRPAAQAGRCRACDALCAGTAGEEGAAPRFECDDCHQQFRLSQSAAPVQSALQEVLQALASAGHEGLAVDIAVRGRCAGCAHPTNEAAA